MAMPASSASRSTASGKLKPSVSITNLKMSPFWPEEKSNHEPLWSLTKNEGVFSCLKGDRPLSSRPARLSKTFRPTTWLTGSRVRISSSREGGKRIEGSKAAAAIAHVTYVIRAQSPCRARKKRQRGHRFPQRLGLPASPAPGRSLGAQRGARGSGWRAVGPSPGRPGSRGRGGQQLFHQGACLAKIHLAGIACLQGGHHFAHVPGAGRADVCDDRGDRCAHLPLLQLLGQELLDHLDFLGFLLGQVLATGLCVNGKGIAALLEHLLQRAGDVLLGELVGARGDFAFLQGGADEAQRPEPGPILRLERCLGFLTKTIAHGVKLRRRRG